MKLKGTKSTKSGEGREPEIRDLRKSMRRLRILTASLFALTIVLNLTPAGAEVKAKITGEDVVDGSLTGADIQGRSLTGGDVAGGSIDGFNIALDTLVGGHVVDDSLTGLDIQDGSLTGAHMQDGSLTGADVQDHSLTGGDVQDNSLTGADIDESTLLGVLSGYEVVDIERTLQPTLFNKVSVTCPNGKFVTGGGYSDRNPHQMELWDNGPSDTGKSWELGVFLDSIVQQEIRVWAICVER